MKRLILVLAVASLMTACSNEPKKEGDKKEMSTSSADSKTERNRQVIMASMAGINAHNADEAVKNSLPDGIDLGDGSTPPVKGVDSIKAVIKAYLNAFPDYHGENLMYITDGDHVAVYGEWSGTFKNDFMGMKATGKSMKVRDVDLFTLNAEGKITEHRSVQSMGPVFAMLGVPMNGK